MRQSITHRGRKSKSRPMRTEEKGSRRGQTTAAAANFCIMIGILFPLRFLLFELLRHILQQLADGQVLRATDSHLPHFTQSEAL